MQRLWPVTMFNKLVREGCRVYKAEYERDRLSLDWHPDPHWSWFVFIAGDSECKMWGFLPVNHRFKGGYGFLVLTEHAWGDVEDTLHMQKTIDIFFNLTFWSLFQILSQCVQFMAFFHSNDICYARLHVVHAPKELPFLRRRLQLMQPVCLGLLGLTAWIGPHWVLQMI